MTRRKRRYVLADTAQQIVGGFLLAGPFVVTEEVWVLASRMTVFHSFVAVLLVLGIGYGTLYKADDRDPDKEAEVAGVPIRFVSLVLVSYASVAVLAFTFNAPATFYESGAISEIPATTVKAVTVGAIFSVVGAATADSLF